MLALDKASESCNYSGIECGSEDTMGGVRQTVQPSNAIPQEHTGTKARRRRGLP